MGQSRPTGRTPLPSQPHLPHRGRLPDERSTVTPLSASTKSKMLRRHAEELALVLHELNWVDLHALEVEARHLVAAIHEEVSRRSGL